MNEHGLQIMLEVGCSEVSVSSLHACNTSSRGFRLHKTFGPDPAPFYCWQTDQRVKIEGARKRKQASALDRLARQAD